MKYSGSANLCTSALQTLVSCAQIFWMGKDICAAAMFHHRCEADNKVFSLLTTKLKEKFKKICQNCTVQHTLN